MNDNDELLNAQEELDFLLDYSRISENGRPTIFNDFSTDKLNMS